jgi:hypothetical protein
MTINKRINVLSDDIIFILDPSSNDSDLTGVCIVEGLIVLLEEKKVGKEKKMRESNIND